MTSEVLDTDPTAAFEMIVALVSAAAPKTAHDVCPRQSRQVSPKSVAELDAQIKMGFVGVRQCPMDGSHR
jgi:hypothetical protein